MARTIRQIQFFTPMRPSVKRVAAYARVSSGKDAMLHSLSAQVSYYSALIQKHTGWLYCGVYAGGVHRHQGQPGRVSKPVG